MGRIQSSTGLVTGINIQETVDQLIAVQARSRDLAAARLKTLQSKQTAVTGLTALVLGVQISAKRLQGTDAFALKNVTSTNQAVLSASAGKAAASGDYQFIPARRAQSHQLLGSGMATKDEPLGAGSLSFRFGGYVNEGLKLDELNGGAGVPRGKIRLTDRSGESSEIDLRFAQTIEDVVTAINNADGIEIEAVIAGDRLQLVDRSGGSGTLKVQEVSGGKTAAGLGLAGIQVAADTASGQDLVKLHGDLNLGRLNDGNGVSFNTTLPELEVTFRDGSSPLKIDFQKLGRPEAKATATTVAANGVNAQVKFTALESGAAADGVTVQFIDSGAATQGSETVVYDEANKTLTFDIAAGATTASDVVAALAANSTVADVFTSALPLGGDGTGLIALADTAVTSGGGELAAGNERTLGDLLATINAADPIRLQAALSADGDRIVLTDLTAGGGTFDVASISGSRLAEELGLAGAASGDTLTSGRLLAGLKTTLLKSANGGAGFGTLGTIGLKDRSGATAAVDLSGAETLDDVLAAINDANVAIEARYNANRTGIELVDTSGATANNLLITDDDATNTATKLGLAADVAATTVDGGSIQRQTVSRSTLLSSYNGGRGVSLGSFTIANSSGAISTVNLSSAEAKTVGDVIDAINDSAVGVTAQLNAAGDGIVLIDTAGGGETLTVREKGGGRAAADLHLLGEAKATTVAGQSVSAIDASTTITVEIAADDTLEDVVKKINSLDAGVGASIFFDGSASQPYHLSLTSQQSGRAGSLLLDGSGAGMNFEELVAGQDALLQFGGGASGGRLLSSSTNTFEGVTTDLDITIAAASTEAVTISVAKSAASVSTAVQAFVDQVNKLRDKLAEFTSFSPETGQKGILFGSSETLRIDADLSRLLTGRVLGGSVQSLADVGVTINDQGKLSFDAAKLNAKYNADPDALEKFFADETTGFAKRADDLVETFAGVGNSLLVNRVQTLQRQIETGTERIDFFNDRLDHSRESLLKQFYDMELAISKLKDNLNSLGSIQYIAPVNS